MKKLLLVALLALVMIPEADAGGIFVNTPGANVFVGGRGIFGPSIIVGNSGFIGNNVAIDGFGNPLFVSPGFTPNLTFFNPNVVAFNPNIGFNSGIGFHTGIGFGPSVAIAGGVNRVVVRRGIFGGTVIRAR